MRAKFFSLRTRRRTGLRIGGYSRSLAAQYRRGQRKATARAKKICAGWSAARANQFGNPIAYSLRRAAENTRKRHNHGSGEGAETALRKFTVRTGRTRHASSTTAAGASASAIQ